MEGYPKPNKVMIKEACEETRLELRLCPPGDGLYSIGTTHPTNSSSNTLMFKSSSKRYPLIYSENKFFGDLYFISFTDLYFISFTYFHMII